MVNDEAAYLPDAGMQFRPLGNWQIRTCQSKEKNTYMNINMI